MGAVAKADIDRAAGRIYHTQIKLGMLDASAEQEYQTWGAEAVDNAEARALSLRAGQEGIVLLQNNPVSHSYIVHTCRRLSDLSLVAGQWYLLHRRSGRRRWRAATAAEEGLDAGVHRSARKLHAGAAFELSREQHAGQLTLAGAGGAGGGRDGHIHQGLQHMRLPL